MYENNHELTRFVKKLKTLKNEVVVLHVMGAKELNFDYKGNVTFEDLETGTKLKVNTIEAKKMYLQSLDSLIKNTKDFLLANNIGYHLFSLDEPMREALQLFLKKRNNLV